MDEASGFEIEHGYADYTVDELLEQAQSNAQAVIVATAAFLGARGVPLEEWVAAIGLALARGWDEPRPWDAGEFLDAMLTNYRSLGAEIVEVDLTTDRAEAVLRGFPDPDICALFGVEPALAAAFHQVAAPIALERGLTWSSTPENGDTRLLVTKTA
jgi:hypothetical protein